MALVAVAKSSDFCQHLVSNNTHWIKNHYASNHGLAFLNKGIMFAFYDVGSFEEWYFSIHQEELMGQFACFLFAEGSLTEIKTILFIIEQSHISSFIQAFEDMQSEPESKSSFPKFILCRFR